MKRQEVKEVANILAETVLSSEFLDKLAGEVAKKLKGSCHLGETEYVDTEEAARILGMSPTYLRAMKDRYPHIKAGDHKQARIMFRRDTLFNQYKDYKG